MRGATTLIGAMTPASWVLGTDEADGRRAVVVMIGEGTGTVTDAGTGADSGLAVFGEFGATNLEGTLDDAVAGRYSRFREGCATEVASPEA